VALIGYQPLPVLLVPAPNELLRPTKPRLHSLPHQPHQTTQEATLPIELLLLPVPARLLLCLQQQQQQQQQQAAPLRQLPLLLRWLAPAATAQWFQALLLAGHHHLDQTSQMETLSCCANHQWRPHFQRHKLQLQQEASWHLLAQQQVQRQTEGR
jgi:hypothetical protein